MYKFFLIFLFTSATCSLSAQSQLEMNLEARDQYEAADKQLNLSYNSLMKLLEPNEKKQLKTAQIHWIKFKEAHCKFEADQYEGGSIQPLIKFSCLTEITKQRTEQLNKSIEDRDL